MKKPVTHFFILLPVLLLLSYLLLPVSGEAPGPGTEVAAHSMPEPSCPCSVTQGNFSSPLPFMSSNTSAVNFYNYGNPNNASANTGLEVSETLLLMMYEDLNTGNKSLIMILDDANDGTGGNADITFNCLPNSAFVEFSDDAGELTGSPPNIAGAFNWSSCCTDGGVIGGVGCGYTYTINPTINSGISFFSLVYGTPTSPIYVNMPQINCPITINCGGQSCCTEAFEFSAITQNATCENSGDGSIDLNTDCATLPTYQWSNGDMTEDLNGLNPGVYSVTITDANGCSQSASYVVDTNLPSPQPDITGPTEFCAGELAELGVSGAYSSVLWSNGMMTSPILVTTPGTYSVTVTNSFGCTGTATTTLTENPAPVPDITGPASVCLFYDTITLDAGPGFTSYLWASGETSQSIDVSEFGGYFVTVTNSFGCTAFDFVIIEPMSNPFPVITGPTSICSGNPITLDAQAGFDTYQWSSGENTQTISPSTEGTYAVTVTNEFDCLGFDSYVVTEYQTDSILLFQTSCNPADTGVFVNQFVNKFGCDSIEILTVSYSESDSVFLFSQSCDPLDTGTFIQTFINQYGCDSVDIETVTLLPSDSLFFLESSCSPQDTGTVVQSLTNQFGCDSVVTTTTTLLPADTVQVFAQSCDPANAGVTEELFVNIFGCDSLVITTTEYLLADTTYLAGITCDPPGAGVFEELFTGDDGCDSLVITSVELLIPDTTYLAGTTCDPPMAGVFEESFTGSDGCDSFVITTVELLLSDTTSLVALTCDINQSGLSEELLTNQVGCDSLIITNTTYIPADTTQLFSLSCNPGEVGIFEEVLPNIFGCDSFLITTVSLLPSDTTALFQTSCDPNQAGTEEVLLMNQYGCDSLLVITTTFAPADSTQISSTTCDPSEAGVSVEILMSTDGCDSVVTTTTTLLPSDTVQVIAQTCDPANAGISEALLFNQFGCDSLVITTTELLPSDTTFLQAITCDINQAGLSEETLPNQYGCDSLIITTTTFIPPDTTLLFAESCDPGQTGTVEVILQNMSGCDSLVITTTTLLPSDTTVLQDFSCDPGQVGTTEVLMTNAFGCDSLIITNTAQLPIDTTWLFFGSCSPMDTGLVVTQLSNQYGCDSLVFEQTSLLPAFECQLDAQILGDTIGCLETAGSLWLTFFDGMPPYEYTWTDQSGNMGSGSIDQSGIQQQAGGLPPGAYTFDILDPNGLMASLSAVIFQPDPLQFDLQVSSDFNGYGISCYGTSDGTASVAVLNGGLPPYSYNWSNGSQTGQADGLGEGWSSVTVTGAVGCLAIDSILLESPDSLQFSFTEAQPDCFTDGLGAIAIDKVEGGNGPYQYALSQNDWQAEPLFEGLASGGYLVEVEDANGCIASSFAFINSFTQLFVSLGQDESIELGDSLTLQPITNLPYYLLDSIYWGGVDCPGCQQVTVAPVATSTYSVTVADSLGCQASDEVQVVVEKNFNVYIPNAFSPDFNGINDHFTIYGGRHLVRIRELHIFDRWGEPVFTYFNFPPNDPAYGWDGTYRGEKMDPAVFVYFAVLEFVDGSTKLVKGDVSLMR
jgi:gliding motility-associated-like protein